MSNENGNTNERDETLTINGTAYVGLKSYANAHGMNVSQLRRYVRNADNPPARKWGTQWLIERDCTIELPVTSTRGRKRADGRQRFTVYVNPDGDELQQITAVVGVANVVDPRAAAAAKRAAAANKS